MTTLVGACADVPIDDQRQDSRLAPPRGVIRGTVTYTGPRPCTQAGHIVGNAVLLVFDRRNPPPPAGLATSAVNFVAVPGDRLFANEPRSVEAALYCPPETETVTASIPFTIAPLEGGSYILQAFYDRAGRFLPTFKFRNQPEAGDVAGGYIDAAAARENAGDVGYVPTYLPIAVGTPDPVEEGEAPTFSIGANGFVADNVAVTLAGRVPFTRPYFHPRGAEEIPEAAASDANPSGDPLAVPIVAMRQDEDTLAFPENPTEASLNAFQESFKSVRFEWGVTEDERGPATDSAFPFGFQLPEVPPRGKGGLLVFARGAGIPETPRMPALWPQVTFIKLADDPDRTRDPQSLVIQGTPEESNVTGQAPRPIVVLQGIPLWDDRVVSTVAGPVPAAPSTAALKDHLTVLIRPAALCLDPRQVDAGGTYVTPHLEGASADPAEGGDKPLFDRAAVARQPLVRSVTRGCLPKGRYAMTLAYPNGQTWTVPNESGGCAPSEGVPNDVESPASCSRKDRPVLLSQGARAVLEIVGPSASGEELCEENPVPEECLHL